MKPSTTAAQRRPRTCSCRKAHGRDRHEDRRGVRQRNRLRQRQVADGPEAAEHRHHANQATHEVARQLGGAQQAGAMPEEQGQGGDHAEEVAEEGDFEGVERLRGQLDHDGHQAEEHRAAQHQQRGANMWIRSGRRRPRSPRRADHPRFRLERHAESLLHRAGDAPRQASSCAPVALPWLTSTSACEAATPASPSR